MVFWTFVFALFQQIGRLFCFVIMLPIFAAYLIVIHDNFLLVSPVVRIPSHMSARQCGWKILNSMTQISLIDLDSQHTLLFIHSVMLLFMRSYSKIINFGIQATFRLQRYL